MNESAQDSLYRKEAVAHVGQQSFGGVLLTQPLSLRILTLFFIAIACAILVFLHFGQYARKVTVSGYLEPEGGVARVYPSKRGIVEELLFRDGDVVMKGQPLVWIKVPFLLADGELTHGKILSELSTQKDKLRLAIKREEERYLLDDDWIQDQIALLHDESQQIEEILSLHISRSIIFDRQILAVKELKKRDFTSSFELMKIESDYLNEKKERVHLSQRLTQIKAEIRRAEHQLQILPSVFGDKMKSLSTEVFNLSQRITEVSGQVRYLVKAPVAGIVAAYNVGLGEPVSVDKSILAILPNGAPLFAWLLIPSRAAGFVSSGQAVRLMYDSFPYQQFGTQSGSVVSVSHAMVNARDISRLIATTEPVFMAKVRLSKGSITAFGKEQALQVDMSLTADIIQAKRTILDWMLEPLYTLRGRT